MFTSHDNQSPRAFKPIENALVVRMATIKKEREVNLSDHVIVHQVVKNCHLSP
jgi:hypothetical protein